MPVIVSFESRHNRLDPLTCFIITANVQFTDVLSYASKLSKYTSAPPNFDSMNKDIKVDFEKPYPDEERMRRRLLYWQNAPQQRLEDRCKVLFFLMYSISY